MTGRTNSGPSHSRQGHSQQGYVWAARASQVAMAAVVPPVLGLWADRSWGTSPWLLCVGAGLGFLLLMMDVIRLTGKPSSTRAPKSESAGEDAKHSSPQ